MATVYLATGVVYCGGECYPHQNWAAFDVKLYESGWVTCGDEIWLYFPDGRKLETRARDAGPLWKYHIAGYPSRPLLADVPTHLWPFPDRITSSPVRITNGTRTKEAFESRATP
jgi:hypothetical protein